MIIGLGGTGTADGLILRVTKNTGLTGRLGDVMRTGPYVNFPSEKRLKKGSETKV